jgi:hypothetical protein
MKNNRQALFYALGALQLRPIADIPNTEGFRFTLVRADGAELSAVVVKGKDGCHKVNASGPFDLLTCKGWKP